MNYDDGVVVGFGDEWSRFDQSALSTDERDTIAEAYFRPLPWQKLPGRSLCVDVGCGSGRWASWIAPRFERVVCIDASPAAAHVARRNLAAFDNCSVAVASVDEMPVEAGTADLVYSLGVLHHVPDTAAAVKNCVDLLRPGGYLLVYLYYSFENRPSWYRALWKTSDAARRAIARLPAPVRDLTCDGIAHGVYLPLARAARAAERRGIDSSGWPLASYRNLSRYSIRLDARDRFGTRLERRFTRAEVAAMLRDAGLVDVTVPSEFPFWMGFGRRPKDAAT